MKKIIYLMVMYLFTVNIQAQVTDHKELQTFIDELKALKSEHVEYKSESSKLEFPENTFLFKVRDTKIRFSSIKNKDNKFGFIHALSQDKTGYEAINEVLGKYYTIEAEELFGIPLMACKREDGEEQIAFIDEYNTLLIKDDGEKIEILYGGFNIISTLKTVLQSVINVYNEDFADIEILGGINFSVHVSDIKNFNNTHGISSHSNKIMELADTMYDNKITHLEEQLSNTVDEEHSQKLNKELSRLKEERTHHFEEMKQELDELEGPEFIEILPESDIHYVAIPKVSDKLKEKMKPYAINGVYDWINNTGFGKGASMMNFDQISCIITPHDVAKEYVIRHFPRDKWFDDGFAAEYKEKAAVEYQGGTPTILYRFSQNEKGYNEMINDLGFLFNCKLGEKKFNLKVVQQISRNGKRFVQLYGEGNIIMSLFDSPQDKYCHMSIIIGGVSGFEQAVNEYIFGGEKDIAKRCNIIIDSDLGDNSYGIHFSNDEYFHAGKMHRNGVHINFGYFEKFTE